MVFDDGINAASLFVIVILGGMLYLFFVFVACASAMVRNVSNGKSPLEGVRVSNVVPTTEPTRRKSRIAFADTSE